MIQRIALDDAVDLIKDHSTFALGGMTLYRRPVAFVRALLRRNPRPQDLTLLAFTAGYAADLLVGAGCVSKVRTCYFGLEVFGFAPMFTEKANRGVLQVIEETETSLVLGLRAQVSGVGSLPSMAWQGTDLLTVRPDVRRTKDPYTGEMLTAFPAISVDVAVIHALETDRAGNVAINANMGIDQLLVYAADTVIVTAERLVDTLTISADHVVIPSPGIDYVSIAPGGALPTSCYPDYPMRGREFTDYIDACATDGGFDAYLRSWLQD